MSNENKTLIKTLWTGYKNDDVDVKQSSIEAALRALAGDEVFNAVVLLSNNSDETAVDTTDEPNEEVVAALIANATS